LQVKKFTLVISLIINCLIINAQDYSHTTLWTRLAFQKKTKSWDSRLEFDYRQQNDKHVSMYNPASKPLMRWVRLNFGYTTGHFTHSFMPAIIKSYQLIGSENDFIKVPKNEIRLSFYEEFTLQKKKFSTRFRLGYEFRDIFNPKPAITYGRLRFRAMETYKISDKTNLSLSVEPQLNIAPNPQANTFSSNQIYLRLQQNITKNLRLELGYNNIFRQRSSLIEYDYENALVCNFIISL
jgi:hypothetical protein